MKAIPEKLNVLLIPKAICEEICRGITNYYNNATRKENNGTTVIQLIPRKSLVAKTFAAGKKTNVNDGRTIHNSS